MFEAIRNVLKHSRRLKELENAVGELQERSIDLERLLKKHEDYTERCFGRLFKRAAVDAKDEAQIQPVQQVSARQFFTGRKV